MYSRRLLLSNYRRVVLCHSMRTPYSSTNRILCSKFSSSQDKQSSEVESDADAWIPPSRALSGDKGDFKTILRREDEEIERELELEMKEAEYEETQKQRLLDGLESGKIPEDINFVDFDQHESKLPSQFGQFVGNNRKNGTEMKGNGWEEMLDMNNDEVFEKWEAIIEKEVAGVPIINKDGVMRLNEDILFAKYGIDVSSEDFDPDEDEEGWEELDEDAIQELEEYDDETHQRYLEARRQLYGDDKPELESSDFDPRALEAFLEQEGGIDLSELTEEKIDAMIKEFTEKPNTQINTFPADFRTKQNALDSNDNEDLPDWAFTTQNNRQKSRPSAIMKPQDAAAAKILNGEIPVVMHTLLSSEEVVGCLESLGGNNVVSIPIPDEANMGTHMIIASGMSSSHLRTMSDALVRAMRNRKLHKMGVIGAEKGAEDADSDDWIALDCQNIIVHLMDDQTRKAIALEKLWAKDGPLDQQRKNPIDSDDEESVENFVRDNPVSDEYTRTLMQDQNLNNLNSGGIRNLQRAKVPLVGESFSRRRPKEGKNRGGRKSRARNK